MEKYMGYRANAPQQGSSDELATINIAGTLFYVDLFKYEFRQVDNPFNRMTIGDVPEDKGSSILLYDTEIKNRYLGNYKPGDKLPEHVRIVVMSPLKDIDPIGLAKRQGLQVPVDNTAPKEAQSRKTFSSKVTVKARKNKRLGL